MTSISRYGQFPLKIIHIERVREIEREREREREREKEREREINNPIKMLSPVISRCSVAGNKHRHELIGHRSVN